MKYLRVKNWERFQHQSDRSLPWIKFFTALLAPTKEPWYSELPDATKALLHHIWLMARVFNGRIPEGWLTREKLNLKSRVNLDPLLESGSIWYEDEGGVRLELELISSRARVARSGLSGFKERTSKEEPNYEDEFTPLWQDYPHRIGRKAALRHFAASRKSGRSLAEIRTALANFKAHHEREQTAMKFIPHGSTWFNNWADWLSVDIPPATHKSKFVV